MSLVRLINALGLIGIGTVMTRTLQGMDLDLSPHMEDIHLHIIRQRIGKSLHAASNVIRFSCLHNQEFPNS